MTDEPRQISVSRDALRADLAELELRLRGYFDVQLGQKANATTVAELAKRVDLHEAGVFPPVWDLKISNIVDARMGVTAPVRDREIKALIDERIESRTTSAWSLRSNKANFALVFVTFTSVAIGLTALLHSFISLH